MKTKEEIIKEHYPFYNPDIAQKDIEINAEDAMKLMEIYAEQKAIAFLESIRDYERESRNMVGFDERETEEFWNIFTSHQPFTP